MVSFQEESWPIFKYLLARFAGGWTLTPVICYKNFSSIHRYTVRVDAFFIWITQLGKRLARKGDAAHLGMTINYS